MEHVITPRDDQPREEWRVQGSSLPSGVDDDGTRHDAVKPLHVQYHAFAAVAVAGRLRSPQHIHCLSS